MSFFPTVTDIVQLTSKNIKKHTLHFSIFKGNNLLFNVRYVVVSAQTKRD